MKKSIVLSIAACAALYAAADYTGPGYYRLQNFKTQRWASVIDDKGSVDYVGTTADLQAIKLNKNFDKNLDGDAICCDPASIVYIYGVGKEYQVEAQGTGIHQIIGRYFNIKNAGSGPLGKLYFATGIQDGYEKYIGDGELFPIDVTYAVTSAKNDYRKWYIHPMQDGGEDFNMFGVRPTVEADGKYYASMFGDFPFETYSEGMKVYTVKAVGAGMALMEEVTGILPKSTPVIIECSSASPLDNRLTIGGEGQAVAGNMLKGAYFCATEVKTHLNYIKFNPENMRVLGTCSDGSLGFVTPADLKYIPANSAYLVVPGWMPKELKCVDSAEYEAGVEDIADDNAPKDVYNIHGMLVKRAATPEEIEQLPAGIYIAGGKKIIVR